ncbi:MAG: hypothetical protein VXZ39_03425 [Planctomycetota bacterium]|nr:hypothetical protein [Planctomycetota bacterium]
MITRCDPKTADCASAEADPADSNPQTKPVRTNREETSAAGSGRMDETRFMEGVTVQVSGIENHAEPTMHQAVRAGARAACERS